MKDRSRFITLAALVALVVALISFDGGTLSFQPFQDTLFWVLCGLLVYHLVFGKGCCGPRGTTTDTADE